MPKQDASARNDAEKERIRAEWTARGPWWDHRADDIADVAAKLNAPLVEAADLAPGLDVLDLASGAGEPAIQIAGIVGPEGSVTATDLVPEMLAGAERRAGAAGATNMRFEIADMEALPFADATFDRVTCRFGIMFPPDSGAALAETLRVLKPGGRAAWLVWGPRENTNMFTVIAAADEEVFGPSSGADLETPFKFGEEGKLASLAEAAGFRDVSAQDLNFTPHIPEDVEFWHPQVDMTMGHRLAGATDEQKAAFADAVSEGFAALIEDGQYVLKLHARVVTGQRS